MQNNTFSRLIVGQKIVVLDRIDSTNNYLKQELAKSTPFAEGTVIMAEEQFAGRGQAQNKWLSEPGQNLTFSIFLAPVFLAPENQFSLNITISLAINDALRNIIGSEVKIKWPNDIYYRNSKLGGVLIENSISGRNWKHAVVGIGINVNQTDFPDVTNVTSIKHILGEAFEKMDLLKRICAAIDIRYKELHAGVDHMEEYLANLLGMSKERWFVFGGKTVRGTIEGIDRFGKIIIRIDNAVHAFGFKEVGFLSDV